MRGRSMGANVSLPLAQDNVHMLKSRSGYCGNALLNGATTSTVDSSQCSSACSGNSAEKCGAAYKLMLYYQANPPASTSAAPTSSAASSTATTSRSTTVSSTTSSPAATSTARGFTAVGCVAEASSGRALTSASYQTSNMTVEYCQTLCSGYHYAGVEYGNECACILPEVDWTSSDIHQVTAATRFQTARRPARSTPRNVRQRAQATRRRSVARRIS